MTVNQKDYEQWKEKFVAQVRYRQQQFVTLKRRGKLYVETFIGVNLGVREAMVIRSDGEFGCSPVVYLDHLYERHQRGESEDILIQSALAQFIINMDKEIKNPVPTNYEQIKEYLRIRVIGLENNGLWEKEKVCLVQGDFIHSAYLCFRIDQDRYGTIDVNKTDAGAWNIPCEQVIADAKKGSMHAKVELYSLFDYLYLSEKERAEGDYMQHPELFSGEDVIYILREQEGPFGASVIARPDILKRVGEIFNDDYYILPSSIEEVLLIPAKHWDEPKALNKMVRTINERRVRPKDRLSNQVKFYDREMECMKNLKECMTDSAKVLVKGEAHHECESKD